MERLLWVSQFGSRTAAQSLILFCFVFFFGPCMHTTTTYTRELFRPAKAPVWALWGVCLRAKGQVVPLFVLWHQQSSGRL